MRDLVWTLIFIWLAWQVVNIFKASGAKRGRSNNVQRPPETPQTTGARKKTLDSEGEYVDYEEVK